MASPRATPCPAPRARPAPAARAARTRRLGIPWLALLLCALLPSAWADEFRPAYLQLVERDAATYDVSWKLPATDGAEPLALRPVFPAGTETLTAIRRSYAADAAVQRWRIHVPGGLAGRAVRFPGLAATPLDVLVRLERRDGTTQLARILPLAPQFVVTASPGTFEVVRTYTVLGIEHILAGVDHLLFVLALMLLVRRVRALIATISAFTLAHSLTLALATLGVVQLPGPPVEAAIALSIVFVAAEILHGQQGRPGLTQRHPWVVAFTFGLLHGLGFAGALAEVGLPQASIPAALLAFNVGVELGQLVFVAAVLGLMAAGRALWRAGAGSRPLAAWLARLPAYAIGGLASYWVFERIAAF
jgi:hypothetical protein